MEELLTNDGTNTLFTLIDAGTTGAEHSQAIYQSWVIQPLEMQQQIRLP